MSRILVLDDVEDAAVLVARILRKKGHRVHAFVDEDEALAFARGTTLDLVVLDMKLRKMEGLEVLAELKLLQPQIKAIMLTGYPTGQAARRSTAAGAAAYCVKPIDKQELEATVAAILKETGARGVGSGGGPQGGAG